VSIKIRADRGCFDRGCCPEAWRIIDQHLRTIRPDGWHLEKHESGPELLVWLALGTAGITLAKSVIDLVTTIIKARAEGKARGDRHGEPIELIVRDVGPDGKVREERLLRFTPEDAVDAQKIAQVLNKSISQRQPEPEPKAVVAREVEKPKSKKRRK
jgi:hypothetical protein